MQQSLAKAEQLNADAAMKAELETRHLTDELDREAKAVKVNSYGVHECNCHFTREIQLFSVSF